MTSTCGRRASVSRSCDISTAGCPTQPSFGWVGEFGLAPLHLLSSPTPYCNLPLGAPVDEVERKTPAQANPAWTGHPHHGCLGHPPVITNVARAVGHHSRRS